ncbi:hypothetical protein Smic_83570 [Streptomyces microflavus]|uniref:Uncharacterized protein n=1 Tax=Streptomyces microflavus TaxID=1919 RepID=A0A7J0D4Y4_STRMI|nr:hypothetical protein Smic_83570 [Streptomyces microflavus]
MTGHPAHHHQEAGGVPLEVLLPGVFVVLLAAGYVLLAGRARRRNAQAGWSRWRTGWFLAGSALLVAGLLPRSRRGRTATSAATCSSTC